MVWEPVRPAEIAARARPGAERVLAITVRCGEVEG